MSKKKATMLASTEAPTEPYTISLSGTTKLHVTPPPPDPRKPGPSVMVAIPSGRTWEARMGTAVTGVVAYSALQGFSIGVINLEGSMITKQRNDLVLAARKHKAEYILFVDSDLVVPADALVRLHKHGKDIVGATYNKRVPPYETLGRLKGTRPTEVDITKGGLREAEQLPGGLVLVRMSVYETLRWPWYYESYQWPGANGTEAFKNMLRDNYGAQPSDEILSSIDGTPLSMWLNDLHKAESVNNWEYYSEDLSFCRKAIKAGFSLWCDLDLTFQITHLGVQEVTCKPPPVATNSVVVPATM